MALTRVRERGQVTIPASYRKQLHMEDNAPVNMVLIGQSVVISPHRTVGDVLAKKFEKEMTKQELSLGDLLKDLKKIRKERNKVKYGILALASVPGYQRFDSGSHFQQRRCQTDHDGR